jgi:putative transposase
MPEYRRLLVPGSCYFFTVNLADRSSDRLTREIAVLRSAVASVRARRAFGIDAWVVLPEHLHAVWTLPEGDYDYSTRWASIKRLFSWQLPGGEARSRSRVAKRERGIWQRRFWEHMIRDEADFRNHVDYVHFNPVRHGLVSHPGLWPYSSFHRAVARGDLPAAWTLDASPELDYGEMFADPPPHPRSPPPRPRAQPPPPPRTQPLAPPRTRPLARP